jgi:hypothetical protein
VLRHAGATVPGDAVARPSHEESAA